MIRVRFAPSPTGWLHVGGARTALYNYLFARHNKAAFILRIEDTDEARSTKESVEQIIQSLSWLGLEWDEGPKEDSSSANEYFQSFRWEKGIYQKYADQLIKSGKAYYCYCTPEELKEKREKAMKEGRSPGYDGYCRNISRKETEEKKARGVKPALRFRVDEKKKIKFLG